ncbi:MAG: ABC transporter permease [Stomatobaculum longum]
MSGMICCEFMKIRRNKVLMVGLIAVLISAGYSAFQMYLGNHSGDTMNFDLLNYVMVFNNTTLVFPAMLTLFGGHLINLEYEADTLKSLLTVPVSMRKILTIKLLVTGFFAVVFGMASFVLAILLGCLLLHFDITGEQVLLSLRQICGMAFWNYIAVSPIIIVSSRRQGYYMFGAGISFLLGLISLFIGKSALTNIFPITAGYRLVHYAAAYEASSPLVSIAVYGVIVLFLILYVFHLPEHIFLCKNPPYFSNMPMSR